MKVALTMMMVLVAGASLPANAFPRGGWDGNNVKLSDTGGSKLLAPKEAAKSYPGGGWDANNVKLSVSNGSKLLPPVPRSK